MRKLPYIYNKTKREYLEVNKLVFLFPLLSKRLNELYRQLAGSVRAAAAPFRSRLHAGKL